MTYQRDLFDSQMDLMDQLHDMRVSPSEGAATTAEKDKFRATCNAVQFNRAKFNRLDYVEQRQYLERVRKETERHFIGYQDGSFQQVTREKFKASKLPEGPARNFYETV